MHGEGEQLLRECRHEDGGAVDVELLRATGEGVVVELDGERVVAETPVQVDVDPVAAGGALEVHVVVERLRVVGPVVADDRVAGAGERGEPVGETLPRHEEVEVREGPQGRIAVEAVRDRRALHEQRRDADRAERRDGRRELAAEQRGVEEALRLDAGQPARLLREEDEPSAADRLDGVAGQAVIAGGVRERAGVGRGDRAC